ncbi:MAG: prepilin-type N-terminal cleavage/methylation domain-containing protein [Candidatus Nanopelagicales bacterium]
MFTRLVQARKEEEGFTLIELLVVIIIIGILAAIAIPVFLNQRKKGWESAVKADLRNAATAEETVLTDTGTYTNAIADLQAVGFKYSPGSNYERRHHPADRQPPPTDRRTTASRRPPTVEPCGATPAPPASRRALAWRPRDLTPHPERPRETGAFPYAHKD